MADEQQYGTILKFAGDLFDPSNVDYRVDASSYGRPAEHESGILYRGPWEEHGGFPEHVRRCALALAAAGAAVQLVGNQNALMRHDFMGLKLLERMKKVTDTTISRPWCRIEQLVPNDELLMRKTTHPELTPAELAPVLRSTVLSVVYEYSPITPAAASCYNAVGQVWVACQQNATMMAASGVDPQKIRVVPIPHDDTAPLLKLRGRTRRPGPVRFVSIGKWEPRKEQRNVLGAFLLAFSPGDPAQLYLKTSAFRGKCPGYPQSASAALKEWLADERVRARGWTEQNYQRHLFIIERGLSDEQMVEFYRMADVYVSLSRGEGFDMPAYDAKLAGNVLVYTPSGGPQDFAAPGDLLVPFTGEVPCHAMYRWGKQARYGDYDISEAASALRTALELVQSGRAADAAFCDLSHFQSAAVGARMVQFLDEMHSATR